MLTSITWEEYLSFVALLLFVYYSFIAFRFYKWELLALAGIKKIDPIAKPLSVAAFKHQFIAENDAGSNDVLVLLSLKAELSALFSNSSTMITATELISSTRKIIQKYLSTSTHDQQQELNHFILTESNQFTPGLLQQKDVEQLWFG